MGNYRNPNFCLGSILVRRLPFVKSKIQVVSKIQVENPDLSKIQIEEPDQAFSGTVPFPVGAISIKLGSIGASYGCLATMVGNGAVRLKRQGIPEVRGKPRQLAR